MFILAFLISWLFLGIGFFLTLYYVEEYDLTEYPKPSGIPIIYIIKGNMERGNINNPLLIICAFLFLTRFGLIMFGFIVPILVIFTN